MYTGQKIYNDLKVEEIEALPFSQPHREIDSAIVQADEEGAIVSYMISPLILTLRRICENVPRLPFLCIRHREEWIYRSWAAKPSLYPGARPNSCRY